MAIVAFLASGFLGLIVATIAMVFLNTGIVAAFSLYMSVGIILPIAFLFASHGEKRAAAEAAAPQYLRNI